jgi:hypothetical protein
MPLVKRERSKVRYDDYSDAYSDDDYDERYDRSRGRARDDPTFDDYYDDGKAERKRSLSRRALDRLSQFGRNIGLQPPVRKETQTTEIVRHRSVERNGQMVPYQTEREVISTRGRRPARRDSSDSEYSYTVSARRRRSLSFSRSRSRGGRSVFARRMSEDDGRSVKQAAIAAADAAVYEAFRLRKGSMNGKKLTRMALAAGVAALASSTVIKGDGRASRVLAAGTGIVTARLVQGPRKNALR